MTPTEKRLARRLVELEADGVRQAERYALDLRRRSLGAVLVHLLSGLAGFVWGWIVFG